MMNELILPLFDDMHVHFRDHQALKTTVKDTYAWCERALVMPNLTPAVDSIAALNQYRRRIEAEIPENISFTPLMSLYLSKTLSKETIASAKAAGVTAIKWYPKGATTNSEQGISSLEALYPLLAAIEEAELLLLIHGEITDPDIDIFDRESAFIDRILIPIRRKFPNIKMVFEHITSKQAADYVLSQPKNLAATITPQHLLFNRNQLLVGGIKPHYYCLPILKTEKDRNALVQAAISGDPRFFLGTDSAPHTQSNKENACGCAGCYTALHAPALYASIFDKMGALDKLEDFSSKFGAAYYELPRNQGKIGLYRREQQIADSVNYAGGKLIPLMAGEPLSWAFERIY